MFCAIAQPFVVNAPAKLASTWFGANERLTALTICVIAIVVGALIGFIFPIIFISDDDEGDEFKQNVMLSLLA